MFKHSGLPVAVIYIRLLVPLTVQNLLNEFLGQSEGVLRDAATVGGRRCLRGYLLRQVHQASVPWHVWVR